MAKKNRSSTTNKGDAADNQYEETENSGRRQFIKTTVSAGIAACAVAAPVGAGALTVLSPAYKSGRSGMFYQVATVDAVQAKPQKFSVVGDKEDAWIKQASQKIGSVFLSKIGDEIKAFHTLCPHAGCMVSVGMKKNPKSGQEEELFFCPCHAAHFALDGERLDGVSPRNLDSLEVKIENGLVFVKFENFIFGISEKRS